MDVFLLLPKNKFDNSHLDEIRYLTDAELRPIIPALLEWMQDANYPIAMDILPILIERQHLIFPYPPDILDGKDVMWKIWIMQLLLPACCSEILAPLHSHIVHLAEQNGQDEDTLEVIRCAKECLHTCYPT